MNERALQFWVGVMVLATGLIAAILILLLGNMPTIFQKTYTLHLAFTDAPNVTENTPVRRSGVMIGRIKKVDLLPSGMVDVTAGIHQGQCVPENIRCRILTGSLLGDAEIEFYLPPGEPPSKTFLADGETIKHCETPVNPLAAVGNLEEGMSKAINSVSMASESLDRTLGKIDKMLDTNQQHIDSIIARTDETLKLVQNTADFTHDLMSDPKFRENLKGEFAQLPETLRSARDAVGQMSTTMKNMDHTMSLIDKNLTNVNRLTQPLGESGERIAANIDDSVRRLNQLMVELETFGRRINNPEGTLGRLTQDDEIYERLNRTIRNVEEISYRLKPIVNDARIISDKLARHPGSILRDAVRPGAGTKGLPPADWDPSRCATQPSTWTR
ncbi:MAG: MCE family protein [Pirellulales bacterium]|nr:MCE family protein [Pirellulales bacterium]